MPSKNMTCRKYKCQCMFIYFIIHCEAFVVYMRSMRALSVSNYSSCLHQQIQLKQADTTSEAAQLQRSLVK